MKTKLSICSISAITAMFLSGCGDNVLGGGSLASGLYADSNITGVKYCIGDATEPAGTTENGVFSYTPGQSVKFVAGNSCDSLTLRELSSTDTNSTDLKILETEASVAVFLQTMDTDGNATNGIQIMPEVLTTLDEEKIDTLALDSTGKMELSTTTTATTTKFAFASIKTKIKDKIALTNQAAATSFDSKTEVTKEVAMSHVLDTLETLKTISSATDLANMVEKVSTTIEKEALSTTLSSKLVTTFSDLNTTDETILSAVTKAMDNDSIKTELEKANVEAITTIITKVEEAKVELQASKYSEKVKSSVDTVLAYDAETDKLTDVIATASSTLGTENADEVALKAILDITSVLNSDEVKALVNVNTDTLPDYSESPLDVIGYDSQSTMNNFLKLADGATIAGGATVLHNLATKLKTSSDKLGLSFSDKNYQLAYSDTNLTYDDSLVIRANSLYTASLLEYVASFSYGSETLWKTEKTATVTLTNINAWNAVDNALSFTHTNSLVDVDPAQLLNDETFFKLTDATRLENAGAYLKEGSTLITTLNVKGLNFINKNEFKYNTSNNTLDAVKDKSPAKFIDDTNTTYYYENILAAQLVKEAFSDTSSGEIKLAEDDSSYVKINIKNFFSPAKTIDRTSFSQDYVYKYKDTSDVSHACTLDENITALLDRPMCEYTQDDIKAKFYNETIIKGYLAPYIVPTTKVADANATTLDDVIVEIYNANTDTTYSATTSFDDYMGKFNTGFRPTYSKAKFSDTNSSYQWYSEAKSYEDYMSNYGYYDKIVD